MSISNSLVMFLIENISISFTVTAFVLEHVLKLEFFSDNYIAGTGAGNSVKNGNFT